LVAVLCLLVVAVAAEQTQTWKSGNNEFLAGKTISGVKKLLGYRKDPSVKLPVMIYPRNVDLPTSFDSRTAWPKCPSIGAIQNQAECGSCWAFGAVEAITDRFCIHKNQTTQLSFLDMVSCDKGDEGCQGGDANSAWNYAHKTGLVSEECLPYTIPTCPPAQQPCLNFVDTPACTNACTNKSINWNTDKHKVSTVYNVKSRNNGIETEIATNGPVEACFEVYEDFLTYKSGVYSHSSGQFLGGHCVKIVGWGVDTSSNVPYWIVANSWTPTWGNQGYFWIKRGDNECGIEDNVVAGLP